MTYAASPSLTVVLLIDTQRERGEWALECVLAQQCRGGLEVLICDFGHADFPPLAGSERPEVRVLAASRAEGFGETRSAAVHAARAPVVAFVEEHVLVLEGWAQAIVTAHEAPCAAVGGEVRPGNLHDKIAWRVELISRNAWSPPAQRGEATVLRWQNVSYKRDILLGYGDRLSSFLDSEGALYRQLRQDGHRLLIAPEARMIHAHMRSWNRFVLGSFHSGRLSAARSLELGPRTARSRLRAIAAALVAPVRWPLVLLQRTRALPEPEVWLPVLAANLPYVLEYYVVVAAAALTGTLFGRGNSSAAFREYELTHARQKPEGAPGVTG